MNKLTNFISVKPALELRNHVDSYYFHIGDDPAGSLKFTYYPHIKHAVTVYKDSVVETRGNTSIAKPADASFTALYSTVKEQPHRVEIQGKFKKVGIVFKPYGLNHFIERSLKEFHCQTISNFREWDPTFQEVIKKVWETEDHEERISLLNNFLLGQKTDNANERFQKIINEIIHLERVGSSRDLSRLHDLNRKTFYRMFLRELNCTPREFLKVLRFRKSLETYLQKKEITLTEAAVSQFYDQSSFIRTVNKLQPQRPENSLKNFLFWTTRFSGKWNRCPNFTIFVAISYSTFGVK